MSDETDVRQVLKEYEQALNAGDAEKALGLYADDGISMAQGLPTLSGDELRESYKGFVQALKMDVTFSVDEVVVASDTIAYALTRSNGTQTIIATGDQRPESNREVFLFSKQDGQWKISRYLFNTPAP
jgi:uncharacterized protein (TIGR02246 family)